MFFTIFHFVFFFVLFALLHKSGFTKEGSMFSLKLRCCCLFFFSLVDTYPKREILVVSARFHLFTTRICFLYLLVYRLLEMLECFNTLYLFFRFFFFSVTVSKKLHVLLICFALILINFFRI